MKIALAAVRSILFVFIIICILLGILCVQIFSVLLRFLCKKEQARRIRDFALGFLFKASCQSLLMLCGVSVSKELCHLDEKPSLLLSNHVTYLDCIVIGAQFPSVFLAKAEVLQWPFLGAACKGLGCLFLDRNRLSSRVQAINQVRKRLKNASVCVFPEGSTTKNRTPDLKRWQSGQLFAAFKAGSSITSIALAYENQNEVAWVDDMELLPHLWTFFKVPRTRVWLRASKVETRPEDLRNLRVLGGRIHSDISSMCLELERKIQDKKYLSIQDRDFFKDVWSAK